MLITTTTVNNHDSKTGREKGNNKRSSFKTRRNRIRSRKRRSSRERKDSNYREKYGSRKNSGSRERRLRS